MTSEPPCGQSGPLDTAPAVHQSTLPGHGVIVVLEQAFGRDSLYQLRAAVAAHAAQEGMPSSRTPDVVLAVSELVANVIRHGSGHGQLRMWTNERSLHCQVTDTGPQRSAPDPAAGLRSARPAPWPVEPGHGLWVVSRLADQASFDAGPPSAASVSFTLEAAGPSGEAPAQTPG